MIIKQYRQKISNWVTNRLFVFFLFFSFFSNQALAQRTVDSLSFQNLSLQLVSNGVIIGSATGFIIEKNNKYYLITNLHVVTGLDYFSKATTDPQQRTPTTIIIWHNATVLGNWTTTFEDLYDRNKNKRWIECEINGAMIDLIALPIANIPKEIKLYPLHLKNFNDDMIALPGFSVSIIGFPNGLSAGGKLAIWKTGHIASDLDIDNNDMPMFLIDATTRPGMSGSMVVFRMSTYLTKDGTHTGIGTRFLGVYAAQLNQEELGYVIKPVALNSLIDKLP